MWSGHKLLTKQERPLRLEKTTSERQIELSPEQIRLLERFRDLRAWGGIRRRADVLQDARPRPRPAGPWLFVQFEHPGRAAGRLRGNTGVGAPSASRLPVPR